MKVKQPVKVCVTQQRKASQVDCYPVRTREAVLLLLDLMRKTQSCVLAKLVKQGPWLIISIKKNPTAIITFNSFKICLIFLIWLMWVSVGNWMTRLRLMPYQEPQLVYGKAGRPCMSKIMSSMPAKLELLYCSEKNEWPNMKLKFQSDTSLDF